MCLARRPQPADAAAERRELKARSAVVQCNQRNENATDRANEHSRDDTARVAMLAEEVADARTVAVPDPRGRSRARRAERRESGRTRSARRCALRGSGSRSPRPSSTVPTSRVRGARRNRPRARRLAAKEDRERDRTIPEVVVRQRRGDRTSTTPTSVLRRPPRARSGRRARRPLRSRLATRVEQAGRIDAVVVGERDEVGGREPRAALRARESPRARAQAVHLDGATANDLRSSRRRRSGRPRSRAAVR